MLNASDNNFTEKPVMTQLALLTALCQLPHSGWLVGGDVSKRHEDPSGNTLTVTIENPVRQKRFTSIYLLSSDLKKVLSRDILDIH